MRWWWKRWWVIYGHLYIRHHLITIRHPSHHIFLVNPLFQAPLFSHNNSSHLQMLHVNQFFLSDGAHRFWLRLHERSGEFGRPGARSFHGVALLLASISVVCSDLEGMFLAQKAQRKWSCQLRVNTPWFINCGTIQIVTIWYTNGTPQLNSRLGFINPELTLFFILVAGVIHPIYTIL